MNPKIQCLYAVVALCTSLAAQADEKAPPASTPSDASITDPSFHACYLEGRNTWMAGMGFLEHAPVKYLGKFIDQQIDNEDGRKRALAELQALQDGKYKTAEETGAGDFETCSSAKSIPSVPQEKVKSCFDELRTTLAMLDSKLRGMTETQAVEDYTKRFNNLTVSSLDIAVKRARDVYSIVKKGEEPQYMEAVFGVCAKG